jgi:hypothetical protein
LIGIEVPKAVVVETSNLSGSLNLVATPKAQQKQQQTSSGWQFKWLLPIAFNSTCRRKLFMQKETFQMALWSPLLPRLKLKQDCQKKTRYTVRHRVLTGCVDGTNAAQISPVADIEPLIADFCIRMAN